MRELEEFKEATKASIAAKEDRLLAWSEIPQDKKREFHDLVLDVLSETPTIYKVTMAQSRSIDDVDQIATLWASAHAAYSAMLKVWQRFPAELLNDELFVYWGETVRKLEQAAREHYEFHAFPSE